MAIEFILSEGEESGKGIQAMWQEEAVERMIQMNDRELLYLKFEKRFSTQKLLACFPRQRKRIIEVALLEINARRLQKLIHEKEVWARLRALRKQYRELQQQNKDEGIEREAVLVREERNHQN